jgi:hypothetical protein
MLELGESRAPACHKTWRSSSIKAAPCKRRAVWDIMTIAFARYHPECPRGQTRMPLSSWSFKSASTRPDGNTVIIAELQKLVSLRDVRCNDGRSSIHRDMRTGHRDCVIGVDAQGLVIDVPSRPSCTGIVSFSVCSIN